jgi:hypothetical protein
MNDLHQYLQKRTETDFWASCQVALGKTAHLPLAIVHQKANDLQ